MINTKLKEIRIFLDFSETDFSRSFNMSSYKYKRCEAGSADITAEMLVLLSVMLAVPLDCLISEEYSAKDILDLPSIKFLKKLPAEERKKAAEKNLYARCDFKCSTVTYKCVYNVTVRMKQAFAENIRELLSQRLIEPAEILKVLGRKSLDFDKYISLPSPMALAEAAKMLSTSIQSLFDEKKMQAE